MKEIIMFVKITSSQEIQNKELERNKISKDEKNSIQKPMEDCIAQYIKIRNKLTGINNPHPWSIIGLR